MVTFSSIMTWPRRKTLLLRYDAQHSCLSKFPYWRTPLPCNWQVQCCQHETGRYNVSIILKYKGLPPNGSTSNTRALPIASSWYLTRTQSTSSSRPYSEYDTLQLGAPPPGLSLPDPSLTTEAFPPYSNTTSCLSYTQYLALL